MCKSNSPTKVRVKVKGEMGEETEEGKRRVGWEGEREMSASV